MPPKWSHPVDIIWEISVFVFQGVGQSLVHNTLCVGKNAVYMKFISNGVK